MRLGAGRDAVPGGPVKYLIVLVGIIGMISYIFAGGPRALTGKAEASVNRRQAVWDRISQLEATRRDMLVRANLDARSFMPPARASRGGAWASGYQEGFSQGYAVGSYLAETRRPNPLFFPIPKP